MDLRKYAWDYFHFHATQRLTTFNFYIVIITVITTGLVKIMSGSLEHKVVGIYLGALVSAISFIFWKIDQRNSCLVHNGEKALKALDQKATEGYPSLQALKIFEIDNQEMKKIEDNNPRNFLRHRYSYSESFRNIFMFFIILGILAFAYCFYSLCAFL